jgi:hypothetical protein
MPRVLRTRPISLLLPEVTNQRVIGSGYSWVEKGVGVADHAQCACAAGGGGEGVLRKGQRAGEEEVSVLNAGNSSWADLLSGDESRQPGLWALPITLPQ